MKIRSLVLVSFYMFMPSLFGQNLNVFESSIIELQSALEEGSITSVDLVNQYLARIDAYDKQGPALNSIIRINPRARELASELDEERLTSGTRSLLHGIPILIKDNYNTVDMPTSGGSVALAGFLPSQNSTQVDLLLEAGAIILAKTNLHEYAYGITSVGSLLGQTRNPYDIRRAPGGSSGGTGAAVAASFGAIGMGSDTCGSIRIPSAFNNLVGLRPSKGLSSIFGIMPLSHTQDTGGPLARSVEDLAITLDLTIGYDPGDAATDLMQTHAVPEFLNSLNSANLEGLRIGKLVANFENAHFSVRAAIDDALAWYEEQGATILEVEIPDQAELIAATGLIGFEFKTDLNRYLEFFRSTGMENLNEIVELGLFHQAVEGVLTRSRDAEFDEDAYTNAIAARGRLKEAIEAVYAEHNLDVMVYPTIAQHPVFMGEAQSGSQCQLAAHSGLPALSMPVGFSSNGLPIGMEFLGKHFQDADLLALAKPYEEAMQPRRAPSVTPALENGLPPLTESREFSFNEAGVSITANFSFSITTNEFNYSIQVNNSNSAEFYAATLFINSEDVEDQSEPIVLNLLGPDSELGAGSYFMSEDFRQAYGENRIYLKVFASSLPAAGVMRAL